MSLPNLQQNGFENRKEFLKVYIREIYRKSLEFTDGEASPKKGRYFTYRLGLQTDVAALEPILFNLVDNACKYGRSAADKPIHIEVVQEKKRVRIRVRDHGPGIAARDIARLFQPFHKSARDAANSAPGVGLGLSLCRRLAQSIGGELALGQNSGTGAAFSLLIPRSR